jgi:hypothetical protein
MGLVINDFGEYTERPCELTQVPSETQPATLRLEQPPGFHVSGSRQESAPYDIMLPRRGLPL